jgi:hypothetical protein
VVWETSVRVLGYCLTCHAWTTGAMVDGRLSADGYTYRGGRFVADEAAPVAR